MKSKRPKSVYSHPAKRVFDLFINWFPGPYHALIDQL